MEIKCKTIDLVFFLCYNFFKQKRKKMLQTGKITNPSATVTGTIMGNGIPSYIFKAGEGELTLDALTMRAFSEAIRQLASMGKTSWNLNTGNLFIILKAALKENTEDAEYWIGIGENAESFTEFPMSPWEIRGFLKQVDLLIEITERKSADFIYQVSLSKIKQQRQGK